MRRKMAASVLVILPVVCCGELPVLEGTALWLEQIPGTTDVLVVGSWTVANAGGGWNGVQGWSYGLCHDPAEASLGECAGSADDPCRCPGEALGSWVPGFCFPCSRIRCTDDMLTGPCLSGDPPGFQRVEVVEDGVTQGVVLMGCFVGSGPEERFELLRISYEVIADSARISFCDILGAPAVPTCYVVDGNMYRPERVEGLTLVLRGHPFIRGDANSSGVVDIADAVFVIGYLFRSGRAPECANAADANDDDELTIADAITILSYLFKSGGPLPEPLGACGPDPMAGERRLTCPSFAPCR